MKYRALSFIFLLLISAHQAQAEDTFCAKPSRTICAQDKIQSDLGSTFVTPDPKAMSDETRAKILPEMFTKARAVLQKGLLANPATIKMDGEILGMRPNPSVGNCRRWEDSGCRDLVLARLLNAVVGYSVAKDDPLRANVTNTALSALSDNDAVFRQAVSAATAVRDAKLARPNSEKMVAQMFADFKNIYIDKIKSWPIPAKDKEKMLSRVRSLRYAGTRQCDTGFTGDVFNREAINQGNVSLCQGLLLSSNSPATFAFSIAHEIAHSFDPCHHWRQKIKDGAHLSNRDIPKPYGQLTACLEWRSTGTPGLTKDFLPRCDGSDQLSEIFADWAAAEVVPNYLQTKFPLKKGANARYRYEQVEAQFCGNSHRDGDSHPSTSDRIDRILFQNPVVRKLSGCGVSQNYCSFEAADAAPASKSKSTSVGSKASSN